MSDTHFVKVTFEPVSESEMNALLEEDERLSNLFSDPSLVEYDGYERGRSDFVMFFYGANADTGRAYHSRAKKTPARQPRCRFQTTR